MRVSLIKKSLPTSLYKREGETQVLDAAIVMECPEDFHL